MDFCCSLSLQCYILNVVNIDFIPFGTTYLWTLDAALEHGFTGGKSLEFLLSNERSHFT